MHGLILVEPARGTSPGGSVLLYDAGRESYTKGWNQSIHRLDKGAAGAAERRRFAVARPVLTALLVIVGIPAVQVGYVVLAEHLLRFVPEKHQGKLRPWLWLAPALFFLGVFLVYPAASTFYLSVLGPDSREFVGVQNYRFAFTEREMLIAFRNNVFWLVVFTGITVSLGLAMAVLTDRVRYEPVARAVMFLPMAISFVAAGVIWKFVYEFRPLGLPQIGSLNALLLSVVPSFQPVAWLVNSSVNNAALILVAVWVWVGFCLVILSAALKGIPVEVLEAARVDGATEWRIFWRIILPMLAPTITVVATTMVIYALKAFDIVYVMTNGNFDTEVIANRMYKEMFNFRDFGRASAMAVILFLATIPVMAANIRRFRQQELTR
ncbi:MAG: sugar ABC transporter permease [Armatimonadetes bacterium]|nr:sugar ABC transporter permease [Armatimonadota bacterium]